MNKKYLYLLIPLSIIFIIAIFIFISSSQTQEKKSTRPLIASTPDPAGSNSTNQSAFPDFSSSKNSSYISPEPKTRPTITESAHLTPEETARKFYAWYLAYPGVTALSSKAYLESDLISDKFKHIISMMRYSESDDPVICIQNKLTRFTVLNATTTGNGRQAVIIQSVPEGKNLHKIILDNNNGKWLVDDTICMP